MPFCPTCRQEYVEGVLACSDCDVALVPVLPPLSPDQGPELEAGEARGEEGDAGAEPVEVWRSHGEIETQVLRGLLESHGIETMLSGEALRITHGFTMDGLAEVRILVRARDAERAREILAAEGALECPKCGRSIRAGETVCRSCGERFEE
jgi:ribosomal protein L32